MNTTLNKVQRATHADAAGSFPEPSLFPALAEVEMRGVSASPGRYTGQVHVLNDESRPQEVQAGAVLAWTGRGSISPALLRMAGALVTGSGGTLSASATIAREYGVPAVVGLGSEIARLYDGQAVEVDGCNGLVRVAS
jgi:phosphohistidine swiveling domain-containing protein